MSPVVVKLNNPRHRQKLAMFDYDWTLVKPKANRKFPKDADDWQWLFDAVPYVLKKYYDDGYAIYVFTNQTKPWKQAHIMNSLETLKIPMTIVIAYDLQEHKPSPAMFQAVMGDRKWKSDTSFFVGDALGRRGDFADTDKGFAENVGVAVKSPESVFALDTDASGDDVRWANNKLEDALKKAKPQSGQEVIIMVGYPGSGKSTVAEHMKQFGYEVVNGDEHKTDAKRVKVALEALHRGVSVVMDATNLTREKRAIYINMAKREGLPVRCIFVATSLDKALERNLQRPEGKRVPRVAYYRMQKTFEAPSEDEGFDLVTV